MPTLINTIMSDNSRFFARIENKSLSVELIKKFRSKDEDKKNTKKGRRYKWTDFEYKNELFSIFSGTGDLMFFADNQNCPEKILVEILDKIQ